MFWIAISLLESDFEYEFLLAVRLLDKVGGVGRGWEGVGSTGLCGYLVLPTVWGWIHLCSMSCTQATVQVSGGLLQTNAGVCSASCTQALGGILFVCFSLFGCLFVCLFFVLQAI